MSCDTVDETGGFDGPYPISYGGTGEHHGPCGFACDVADGRFTEVLWSYRCLTWSTKELVDVSFEAVLGRFD